MSTVKATHFEHPNALTPGITLASDGSVALPQGFSGGIGTNVVQTVKTDTFSTTSTSFTTVTGLTASITPSSETSKVLVIVDLMVAANDSVALLQGRIVRGGSPIYVGDAAGSRTQSAFNTSTASSINTDQQTIVFLDSPATTSSTTYGVEVRRSLGSGTIYVNRSYSDTDASQSPRTASSITVIEVAA